MRRLAVILSLTTVACGGSSGPMLPTPVEPPRPQTVQVLDGITHQHVTTVSVLRNNPVTVEAPGYLPRRQTWTGGELFLWPEDERAFVEEMVYGAAPLRKWDAPSVGVVLHEPGAERALDAALSELTRVTGVAFERAAQGPVSVRVAPDDPRWANYASTIGAFAAWRWDGRYRLTEVDIVFRERRPLLRSSLILHELGHAIGLDHTEANGVMRPDGRYPSRFTEPEARAIHMAYFHRQAGNLAPDSEAGAGAAGVGGTEVVACP